MITRRLEPILRRALEHFPVVALTGPRQSGKTTLARQLGGGRPYATLEDPDLRSFASEDPRGFLSGFPEGGVLDEIQRCPQLFSYLQGVVDARGRSGHFIVTGSQQFHFLEGATQSLAGRMGLYQLPPFSLVELQAGGLAPSELNTLLWQGQYPPIHDRKAPADQWLRSYVATYLERDVRLIANVRDFAAFQRFVQLCAGRVGQLLNVNSLASDAGISRPTAEAWLSVLQASYLIFLCRPHSTNLSKRLIKTPKLYFGDVGLAAWLLGVREPGHLQAHPLRGALFENWVMAELMKLQASQGEEPRLEFLRDKEGHEVDALLEHRGQLHLIEMKAGQTIASDHYAGLNYWRHQLQDRQPSCWLIHGGDEQQKGARGHALPWHQIGALWEAIL